VSCVIHDWGQWQASGENDLHGLGTGGSGTFIWYLWNTVYHLGGDGCGNSHLGNYGCHDVFVGGNTFYECRENGIDLKTTYNYVISENIIHDFTSTSTSSGEGIVLHYGGTQDGPYNIWVLNNTIYNCALAIAISDSQQDNWLIGNVIYDCTAGISVNSTSTVDCKAYHNTIYNCTYDILYGVSQSDARASGNILANAATRNLEIELSALTALGPYQNNCLYNSGGGALIRWYNTFYSGASAVASWIAGRSNCSGNIQADPQFVNAAAHDFTLQSASPCRGAGYNMAAIAATFAANWGTSLLKDAGGTARPNGVWDIGAYQYAGGVLPPVGSGTLAVR
jgi:parallel beta-helix repeat protein